MKKIYLRLDYGEGPIVAEDVSVDDGPWGSTYYTGIASIDEDEQLRCLNKEAQDLYMTFFEFSKASIFQFNPAEEKKHNKEMVDLLGRIQARLDELQDGSFVVEDEETKRLINLDFDLRL